METSLTELKTPNVIEKSLPDHTQLPCEDGTFVKNFQEHPQTIILTDSIGPVLQQIHPDGQYAIGQDSGIYWRITDPPERGSEAPDWFYVPNVPPLLNGQFRRSYVLWQEHIAPLVTIELASGDGSEERDSTPLSRTNGVTKPGKFWVYEQVMRIPYYGIFIMSSGTLEMYHWNNGRYELLTPNEQGRYWVEPLGVFLGLWQGSYQNQEQLWLRWWDSEGNLLLTGEERAVLAQQERDAVQQERDAVQQERDAVQQERDAVQQELQQERDRTSQQLQQAISRFASLGLNPEQIAETLNLSVEEVQATINYNQPE
ncbi:Uma2 family endonuclease [Spirulina sp. CS-785/01]|uniref:Uma2 family endonuclease n=1 Tax=Spirulina sp. CS-785/01 TaxID=3021716 RepID=UPI00232C45C3|nr:Uma2 family endonuclease [Spirulina sp. CS-785/01]MDB9312717.1 Uma2 family endonuclease [Spirulina sp. CS-785/01]